eukprot:403330873
MPDTATIVSPQSPIIEQKQTISQKIKQNQPQQQNQNQVEYILSKSEKKPDLSRRRSLNKNKSEFLESDQKLQTLNIINKEAQEILGKNPLKYFDLNVNDPKRLSGLQRKQQQNIPYDSSIALNSYKTLASRFSRHFNFKQWFKKQTSIFPSLKREI